jgi:hypothetical protein
MGGFSTVVLAPPVVKPPLPAYDYIIDIYSDKIVITASDGSTTTLNTISDLNGWLKNVRDKKIRINAHVEVTADVYLTRNEYWIFGEWFKGNVLLTEDSITLISFAPLGYEKNWTYVTNKLSETEYFNCSNLKLYALTYADVYIIWYADQPRLPLGSVHVEESSYTLLGHVVGDVNISGRNVSIEDCILRRAFLLGRRYLRLDNVAAPARGVGSYWYIISLFLTDFYNVNIDNVDNLHIYARYYFGQTIEAGQSFSIPLPKVVSTRNDVHIAYSIERIGVFSSKIVGGPAVDWLGPLPPEITYSFDLDTQTLTITNNLTYAVAVDAYAVLEVYTLFY